MDTSQPITQISGVGETLAERFARLGVTTVGELLHFYPRIYENYGAVVPTSEVAPGKVTLLGRVVDVRGRYVRRGLHITEATIEDAAGQLRAVWFNQPYRERQVKGSDEFYLSGTYEFQRGRYLLMNPSCEKAANIDINNSLVIPIYRETKGLNSRRIRQVMQAVLPLADVLPETLPGGLLRQYKLAPLAAALRGIHAPESEATLEAAKKRLEFEELLAVLLAAVINKRENAAMHTWRIPFDEVAAKKFVAGLPFNLTDAQRRSAWEIVQNFEAGQPMNRLLQGDVGSGKTVVAAMAAHLAARAGYQTAFMAPTEVLAAQHAETIAKLLEPYNVTVGLLTGSVKPNARSALLKNVEQGAVAVAIGTHALIQPNVTFHKLGFVVIDEQHRFGVEQRRRLLEKSPGRMPHLLSMSATPIPRSLALTVYGELDISVLDVLPAGRKPIMTKLVSPNSRAQVYAAVEQEVANGRQAYILCPQIEGEEAKSVEMAFKKLSSGIFKHRSIAMLHGRMKPTEKEAIMSAFKQGAIDILVSTTVIEVGVDVPNATVMVIEYADTFGLAQLHQLRGRVGRSDYQSYCYLIPSGSQASQRLRELEQSHDGFYLAETDLRLRGPGEVYGRSQHGQLDLRLARLGDTKLTKEVRDAAEWLLNQKINLADYPELHARVEKMRRVITLN